YWTGLFQLTRKTQIFTQLDADVGKLNALNSLADSATAAAAGAQAPGGTVFFDTSARESIYHDFTPNWRLDQVGSFRVFVPLVSENQLPVSWGGTLSLATERTFKKDAVGVELRAEYIQYDELRDPTTNNVTVAAQRQMVLT